MFYKILITAAMSLCIICPAVYSEESGKREKVLVLPFRNESDTKQYVNSGIFQEIFSRSFYSFISLLPVIEVPDIGKTRGLTASSSNIRDFADREQARIVIYGSYRFTGTKTNPRIQARLTAYDGPGRTNIFNKTYETSTGAEVFDDIDMMISEVMKGALDIDVKNIAAIRFKDFRIADETYLLYVNGRLVASPSNTNFSLILKIMPETNYSILLKQKTGERTVLKKDVRLGLNGSTNISYFGSGSVRIGGIYLKDRLKSYAVFFDGRQSAENSYLTNVLTDYTHNVLLVENLTNTNYSTNFDLYDNQEVSLTPAAGPYGSLHLELLTLDFDMASLLLEYFPFDRYFFVQAGSGFYTVNEFNTQYYYISPLLEIGYYWVGDMAYNFRIGTGIIGRVNVAYSPSGPVPDVITPALFNLGLFVSVDFYFITVRPECYFYYENGKANFTYAVAAGIHF